MPIAPEYLHMVFPNVTFHALLYGRASRDPKKKGRSVADQINAGTELCDQFNWPIAEVFDQDVDRSASRHARRKRKDFESLIDAIESGRGRIVVAWEASRYYRDIEAYIRLRNACMASNVLLCYNGQVYDLSKREDRKATAQDAIAAEDEAEGIRDRVLRTTRAQAKKGAPHGRVLWGYARRYDPDSGELIEQYPHPERSHIVLRVFERVAAGETGYSIMQDLRAHGERLPGIPWEQHHVTTMVRNRGYAGRRIFQGEDVGEAIWPAIVPMDLFLAVQKIISDPSRLTTKDRSVKHLLSGVARCGVCAHTPHLKVLKSRGALSYQCSEKYDTVMRTDKMDAYVEEAVIAWLASKAAVTAFQSSDQEQRTMEARAREEMLTTQLEEARAAAGEFDEQNRPRLSITSLMALEARLEPLIDEAKREAEEMTAPPLLRRIVGRPLDETDQLWNESLTVEQQRTVLRTVVNIRLNRARAKGVRSIEPGRINLTFVGEPGFVSRSPRRRSVAWNAPAGEVGR
ncbi:recombinase family protein [Streptomyces sp. NPDC058045]|uniref:recombinase family protein n=1 Tax=Streptomyces sp. NPDC058045 TaxID=3346311 RepID=UPI0036E37F96